VTSRVSADVDGHAVWFESPDARLRAAPEAFACTFLIPALHRGARLELDAPLCPSWSRGAQDLLEVLHRWWGVPRLAPESAEGQVPERPDAPRGTGLCFSAGVDSFYTLLRSGERVDRLVTVQGFDIDLDDSQRMAALSRSLRKISQVTGIPSIVVRTNLRSHPLFSSVAWERAHGGPLAAIGHVLDDSCDRLLISSSVKIGDWTEPWGSHWEIDRLWSSSRMTTVDVSSDRSRTEKIVAIAGDPMVHHHLRVCWENRTSVGNCSQCEKCLATMLELADVGVLDRFTVFEGSASLVARIDALPQIRSLPRTFAALEQRARLPPDVRRAVRNLRRRTRPLDGPGRRMAGTVKRWWSMIREIEPRRP
jgi:hypothetical protein